MRKCAVAGVILILVFAAMCAEKDTEEITKENIGQKVSEAYEDVETYTMSTTTVMNISRRIEGEDMNMTMSMTMDSAYDLKNAKQRHNSEMRMDTGEEGMSYTLKQEMHLVEKAIYLKMLGEWYEKELEESPVMDQVEAYVEIFDASEIMEMKEEKLDGEAVYYLSLELTLSELVKTFTKMQGLYEELGISQMAMDPSELENMIEEYEVYLWISKKDLRIVKMVTEMDIKMEESALGETVTVTGQMVTTTLLTEYNKAVTIELPEDAQYAQDWEHSPIAEAQEQLEELEEKKKSIEKEIGSLGSKLRIINLANDDKKFYMTVKNETEYKLVPDDGNGKLDKSDKESEMQVIIKNESKDVIVDCIIGEKGTAFSQGPISSDAEGQIEVTVQDIELGGTYIILLKAGEEEKTQRYTAI
ncbi:MAG: DUF6612 family protein [Euryarchaeota archaeon]|nr:DUF6612 family protein [Euryarchaeota archaeon]